MRWTRQTPGHRSGLGAAERRLLAWQGRRELAAGRHEAARDAFLAMAFLFPTSADAQRGLAEVADRSGRPAQAAARRAIAARLEAVCGDG